ncbi:hypothetical protein A3A42_03680 [Candidatus Kaiserbacteria bacterium RIFCSPLOWO2_01_FULL_55_25]|nr:MAG: hypothetical protein A3A42_03680 [Candidatus Kaiserbacteria bacterium RIFCSPLOWO2_01_FULL_55_25]
MTEELLKDISKKLNILISMKLGRINDTRLFDKDGEIIQGVGAMTRYLADMGLEPKDIAEILGAPLQSVRTLLTPNRRK